MKKHKYNPLRKWEKESTRKKKSIDRRTQYDKNFKYRFKNLLDFRERYGNAYFFPNIVMDAGEEV